MALPNHPDVFYEFVRTLKDCGYRWVIVQEHTVERVEDGGPPAYKHQPYRLVARNSRGETLAITAIIKTQGSDTKLIGQMQPYYEALGLNRVGLAGRSIHHWSARSPTVRTAGQDERIPAQVPLCHAREQRHTHAAGERHGVP
jgi:hypothetical protein